jgi:hypothetical protein
MRTIILFLLLPLTSLPQNVELQLLKKQYLQYCDSIVSDSAIQTGYLTNKEVPVYNKCNEIVSYKLITDKDTTWNDVTCPKYKGEYYWDIDPQDRFMICDTMQIITTRYTTRPRQKVTRKIHCITYLEKASPSGFIRWLYNQVLK